MEQAANLAEPSSAAEDLESYYASDAFRMTSMKVLPCSKRYVHDWTECPLAHPQEKARRRDPRTHNYTGIACPSMKKEGSCAFGDHCPYAHNVFEYWLHPTRYRTQLCNDGSNCRRKICFFAHGLDELRVPACKPFVSPEALAAAAAAAAAEAEAKRRSGVVGSPVANLAMPVRLSGEAPRLSVESMRQSTDWGPVPLPTAQRRSNDSSGDEQQAAEAAAPPAPPPQRDAPEFSSHEQQVIEMVTAMLAQDKVTPTQAASILQQMLPAASLQLLQARLGVGPPTQQQQAYGEAVAPALNGSFGAGPSPALEQLAAMQAAQAARAGSGSAGPEGSSSRHGAGSFESARSSQDTQRMSIEGSRGSSEYATPRGSGDYTPAPPLPPAPTQYATPAPAYPQYWARQQLSTVPEGVPLVSAPPPSNPWARHSLGSMDSAADRLSSDFGRMNVDAPAYERTSWTAPQPVNAYSSSLFSGQGGGGAAGGDYATYLSGHGQGAPVLPERRDVDYVRWSA